MDRLRSSVPRGPTCEQGRGRRGEHVHAQGGGSDEPSSTHRMGSRSGQSLAVISMYLPSTAAPLAKRHSSAPLRASSHLVVGVPSSAFAGSSFGGLTPPGLVASVSVSAVPSASKTTSCAIWSSAQLGRRVPVVRNRTNSTAWEGAGGTRPPLTRPPLLARGAKPKTVTLLSAAAARYPRRSAAACAGVAPEAGAGAAAPPKRPPEGAGAVPPKRPPEGAGGGALPKRPPEGASGANVSSDGRSSRAVWGGNSSRGKTSALLARALLARARGRMLGDGVQLLAVLDAHV